VSASTPSAAQGLYSDVIRERWRRPRHRGELPGANAVAEDVNPLCGDRVRLMLAVEPEGRIADARFVGDSCAICAASADVVADLVSGRSRSEAVALELADVLNVLQAEIRPTRTRCVTLPLSVLAQALGVALYARERRGEGRYLEVSLTQCAAAILGHKLVEHGLEGGAPRQLNVPTGVYRTRNGWIIVALVREAQYTRLVGALGRPDLAEDPRFADFAARAAHAAALCDIIASIFPSDTTEGWLDRLRAADILADRINGFDDWLADPHIVATGGAVRVDQPGMGRFHTPRTPGISPAVDAAMTPAPRIGEHGNAILAELGIDAATIARLRAENILLLPEAP